MAWVLTIFANSEIYADISTAVIANTCAISYWHCTCIYHMSVRRRNTIVRLNPWHQRHWSTAYCLVSCGTLWLISNSKCHCHTVFFCIAEINMYLDMAHVWPENHVSNDTPETHWPKSKHLLLLLRPIHGIFIFSLYGYHIIVLKIPNKITSNKTLSLTVKQ